MALYDSLNSALSTAKRKYVAPVAKGVAPATTVNITRPSGTPTTIDPMYVSNQKDAIGSTVSTTPSLFSGTAPGVGTNYANTLNSALTGQIYDPLAAGAKEAQARSAANARASTAGQIASAGFSGTGIGQSIAGGTENQLTKQKFDTLIGVEQARNEGRVNALSEARSYGTAENTVRENEQNFQQDKMIDQRNFSEDVRRYGQDYAENKRQYDQNYAQDITAYGDTQNWKAFEALGDTASDADYIAAYKLATGKTLDAAGVALYRGYARTAAEQKLQQGAIDLNSGVGKDLAAAIVNFPDLQATPESINDPKNATVKAKLQAMWDSLPGKKGTPMDDAWAAEQVKAVKDSGNTMIMANKAIDDAVLAGVYNEQEGATLKRMMGNKDVLAAWVPDDPANPNGPGHFDPAKVEAALMMPAGSLGATTGTDGKAIVTFDPETATNTELFGKAGDDAIAADPTSDGARAVINKRAEALISGKEPWTTLGNAGPGDPVYDRVLAAAPERYIGPSSDVHSFRTPPGPNEVVKIPDGKGGFTLAKMTKMWDTHLSDADRKNMELVSLDGKTTYTASFRDGYKGESTTWTNTPVK